MDSEKARVMDESNKHRCFGSTKFLYNSFSNTPNRWDDCQMNKKDKKLPDFKHMETNEALRLEDKRAPAWISLKLNDLRKEALAPSPMKEDLWKSLLADPSKWHDYRKIKKSNKQPDFKHKNTPDGLWIDSVQTPEWVKSMLKNINDEAFAAPSLWRTFFSDPSKWFDNRRIKKSNNHPDFRHKDTGEALWIEDKKTPSWVTPMLDKLQAQEFRPLSTEKLWSSLFVDPSQWVDYRKIKKSDKQPDFSHRDTKEGLWIEAMETPPWIVSMLNNLKHEAFAPSPSKEYLWKMLFDDPSKWLDNRKIKKSNKHPDFKHKDNGESLWIVDKRTPTWVFSKLNDTPDEVFVSSKSIEYLWKSFFADPTKWLDFRKTKRNNKFPDFKHKNSHKALWINSKITPAWVFSKFNDIRDNAFSTCSSLEDLWVSVFVDQSKWLDYRKIKKNVRHPDFVHKVTYEALWIETIETPTWVKLMLKNLQNESFAPFPCEEKLWESFFDDPSKWFDNRKVKKNGKHADFLHKGTRAALWIDGKRTPGWVLPKLNNLKFEMDALQDEITACHEAKWKDFFDSPSEWTDNRASKKNPNAPDFRHKNTKEALWVASNLTPNWVVPSLRKLQKELL